MSKQIISQVWDGTRFVNTDSDTVDTRTVDDNIVDESTLWTSKKVSEEVNKRVSLSIGTATPSTDLWFKVIETTTRKERN